MRIELSEVFWLEEHQLSLAELAELSGLPMQVLDELVASGAIEASQGSDGGPAEAVRFGGAAIRAARTARRWMQDFELDAQGLVLGLSLLSRVERLELQLRALRARLPRAELRRAGAHGGGAST
jgi:MerR-like DNA binding protein